MLEEIINTFSDWPMGTIVAIIGAIWILYFVGLIGYGIFWCFDYIGMPTFDGYGVIESKSYTRAWIETLFVQNGKVIVPQTIHHPATFSFNISVGKKSDNFYTNESFWEKFECGDEIKVVYRKGRLSNNIYIDQVGKLRN